MCVMCGGVGVWGYEVIILSLAQVLEKPSSPEHLTFQEKLALHKKVADVPITGRGRGGSIDTKTSSISPSVDPASVPVPVNRPSMDMDRTASPSEWLPWRCDCIVVMFVVVLL